MPSKQERKAGSEAAENEGERQMNELEPDAQEWL
jgi:hypothetical protein